MSDNSNTQGAVWLSRFWCVPALLVCLTLCSGVAGWLKYQEYSFLNALYRSFMAFGLSDIYAEQRVSKDLALRVCRWSGLATILFLGSWAVLQLLGRHWEGSRARWSWRKIVVIGEHPLTELAVQQVSKTRRRCLHLGAGAYGKSGSVFRLPWSDARRKGDFTSAHVRGATRILIAGANDAESLALARIANRHAPTAVATVLLKSSYIYVDAVLRHGSENLRILNMNDLAVRSLHLETPPFLLAEKSGHDRINALIVGFGEIGKAVLRDLTINCRVSSQSVPDVKVIDPECCNRERLLRQSVPELDKLCSFTAIEGAFCDGLSVPSEAFSSESEFTAIWLCLEDDEETLAALGHLEAWMRGAEKRNCSIFVFLSNPDVLENSDEHIITFGALDDIVAVSEFDASVPDQIARACHGNYLARISHEMLGDKTSDAAKPWASLSETYRLANRALRDHLAAKLASAGIDEDVWRVGWRLPHLPAGESLMKPDSRLLKPCGIRTRTMERGAQVGGLEVGGLARKMKISVHIRTWFRLLNCCRSLAALM